MNPHVLFWIPAALRLVLIWTGSAVLWYFFGPIVGLLAGLALTTAMTVVQLYYLSALDIWLDSPRSDRLPDGWGAWHAVYAHLYRLNHDEEKSKKELTEWLTRFREAMSFLPDGVAIMDNVLFLEWCNPVAEKHLGLDLERDKDMRITNLVRVPAFIDYIILGRYDKPLEMKFNDRYLVLQIVPFGNRRQILVTHDRTDLVRTEKIRRDFDRVRPGCAVRAARACNQPAAPAALLHPDDSGADDCGVRPDNGILHPQLSGQLHLPARNEPARRADCGESRPCEHLRGQRRIRAGHSGQAVAP